MGLAPLVLLGCGDVLAPDDVQQVKGDVGAIAAPPPTAATISFTPFSDDVGAQSATESRTLIRSARGYQSFFGHAAPAVVDFSREWVMFYAAGTKPTGGYEASFLAVLRAGPSLIAITQLMSPGADCGTTQAVTKPYALIKFPAQSGTSAQFFKQDVTSDCGPTLCAAVTCPTGSDCDPATGKCVPGPVRCGGIAGIACPGFGQCVDDPSDSCDPAAGGADCGGICACVQNVLCVQGTQFDSSPSVCACVPSVDPCSAVLCAPGTVCQAGKCLSAGVACGGLAGTPCPGFGKCVDDPNDSCDPAAGGADCGGICSCIQNVACDANNQFDSSPSVCTCVPVKPPVCPPVCDIYCQYGNVPDANGCPTCQCNPPPSDPCATVKCAGGTHCDAGKCVSDGVACGGFAGTPCPGIGKCGDDPNDSCDPATGGADCPGICSCVQNVLCVQGTQFDGSPSVCACVPVSSGTCPPEKCPTPAPASPSMICADGSIAGPVCAPGVNNVCGWTITRCPTPAAAP